MRQSCFVCLSILLSWATIDSCSGQLNISNVIFVQVTPMSETQVVISFTPPVTGSYSILYDFRECNDFSASAATTVNVSAADTNGESILVDTTSPGQDVSARVNALDQSSYTGAVSCGKSLYAVPAQPNVSGLVDTNGLLAADITTNAEGLIICEVEYRLEGSSTVNTVVTTSPPFKSVSIGGLTSNLAYEIRGRCGVNSGNLGEVTYGSYSDWKVVLAAPLSGSICNGQRPVGMSVVTIAVLLVCAVLARHIPALNL